MGNLQLDRYDQAGGSITASFIIDGANTFDEVKYQNTVDIPVPYTDDDNTLLATFVGQVRKFTFTFILMERTDDYTNGTGSHTDDIDSQRIWLMTNIFTADGYHILTDANSNIYAGRITQLQIATQGDDPLKADVICEFSVGVTVRAS